jgi:ubiquinone/menaquinone biosynthesis C-methylase UbiE
MNKNLALQLNLTEEEIKKLEFNHSYWEKNAQKYKEDHTVSWGDINIITMEINNIARYLEKGDKVLDAGCSNGFSTFEIATKEKIHLRAFDYSKQSIKHALAKQGSSQKGKHIVFYHGNILNIDEPDNTFDKVYTIRVVINILSWKLQKHALMEMHRVLKPGGLFLLSEAFAGSLKNINQLRKLHQLKPLVMHDFNLYLEEKKLEKFLTKHFEIIGIHKFSSTYYVASRFLRYFTMNKKDKDSFINNFNNFFKDFQETDQSGDFGIQKLYVLRKK